MCFRGYSIIFIDLDSIFIFSFIIITKIKHILFMLETMCYLKTRLKNSFRDVAVPHNYV